MRRASYGTPGPKNPCYLTGVQTLYYVDLGTPQVWEVNTGVAVTSPLLLHSSWVTDVAIAADGSNLLTAGDR